jgi:hypothetical protein
VREDKIVSRMVQSEYWSSVGRDNVGGDAVSESRGELMQVSPTGVMTLGLMTVTMSCRHSIGSD